MSCIAMVLECLVWQQGVTRAGELL